MLEEAKESIVTAATMADSALPDWYLQNLVEIVSGNDNMFPITLFVGGLMVSGQLVSGHKYFEGLGEQLARYFGEASDENKQAVEYLISPKDIYIKTDEDQERPRPQYIHLREARVFTAGQQPIPTEGTWWRGRLSNIDGFHFGSLSVAQST